MPGQASVSRPEAELLPWDSEFWGFRIGRVVGSRLDAARAAALDAWAERERVECLYFLGDDEPETVRAAVGGDYDLVEPRLTLTHRRDDPPMRYDAPGVSVRDHRPEELPQLAALARRTGYVTRFVFDDRFPRDRVADYYAAWIGFADAVLVAEAGGEVAGYITCRLPESGVDSRFGIVAVEEAARGAGAADALLAEGARWLEERGMETVSVDVAARNVRTQRYVQQHGFRTTAFGLWFHKWYER